MQRLPLAAVASIVLLLIVSGCSSSGSVSTTPVQASPVAQPNSATPAMATASPSSSPSPSASQRATTGDTIVIAGSTSGDQLSVTVEKVVDPDSSNDGFSTPPAGDRYVSVQFQIVNSGTGSYPDDPLADISAKDSSGQNMNEDYLSSTTAGAQMSSSVNLAPGDKALGFVTFDVPTGDKIAQVQYALNEGIYGNSGEWQVG